MLSTGIRTPVGVKMLRQQPGRDGRGRAPGGNRSAKRSGHVQRLCRARQSAAITSTSCRTASAIARYGLIDRRCPGRDRRWRLAPNRHNDGGRPRTLYGRHALSARSAQRSGCDRRGYAGLPACRRGHSARRSGQHQAHARPDHDPHRGWRNSRIMSMSISATAISAAMSPRRQQGRGGQGQVPAGNYPALERPVRISANGPGAPATSSCRRR